MKTWIVLLLIVGLHSTAAVLHSLKYFLTTSSGVPNFPEFVAVALVDEIKIVHYDSNTGRAEPKQVWMNRVTEDDPQFMQSQTELAVNHHQAHTARIEVLKQRFNQTGGVHIYQKMAGCEWDDETNNVNGYYQAGYDGEDFISFDLKTETWIAPKQQAVITKRKWDVDKARTELHKQYLTQICPGWLKKLVNYGSSSLLRTELPSLSFLQKTPSSPISCHATGFYPERAALFWRKDGEDLHEDVDLGEILPNHDGTFQMSADLKLSVAPEDRRRYDCVFQLSGGKVNIVTRLEVIRSNKEEHTDMTIPIIAAVLVLALVLSLSVIGFVVYRKKNADCHQSSDNSSELSEKLKDNPAS